jgi:hypothetical protein
VWNKMWVSNHIRDRHDCKNLSITMLITDINSSYRNDIITHYQNIDRLKDDISEFIPEEVIKYVVSIKCVELNLI